MKVTKEKTENSQAFLTIEMEPAEIEESLEMSYRRLVQRARIPGFRKGRAPRPILERYLGRESLLEEALSYLIPQAYEKALKEQALEAIAQPQIEIIQNEPVVFKAIVPLKPTVKLGDYQHLQVKAQPVVEVTESEVSVILEQLRHQYAIWEPVERPVAIGDLVVLDIESSIEDKPFINQKGWQYQLLPDRVFPVLGFAEQLVGMKKNEAKEFKLQLPVDYTNKELAGKETWFRVGVSETKQEVLPELSDEFASRVSADLKTLDALRAQVFSSLKVRAEEKARIDLEEQVLDVAASQSEVEYPPILVENEIDRLLNQYLQRSNQRLEDYLKNTNKTVDEIREELRSLAIKNVTRSLVLDRLAEEERIEVSDAEVDTKIANLTKNATDNKDKLEQTLNTPSVRQSIRETLVTKKSIERLVAVAQSSKENQDLKKEETE